MKDLLEKLKKGVEESFDALRDNAVSIKDIAGDYGKIAKLRFEKHQLQSAREKKLTLLGKTIYPYMLENRPEHLREHETLPMLVDEIKNLDNQIELLQLAIKDIAAREIQKTRRTEKEALYRQIEALEEQIEKRLNELKAVRDALDK
ncbi:MAG: hypothetical protein D6677_14015 [Calditrichaeota bacterium]|nr:MAG: hypothetical protein D6677_14015 [Calditrichota bacterium]